MHALQARLGLLLDELVQLAFGDPGIVAQYIKFCELRSAEKSLHSSGADFEAFNNRAIRNKLNGTDEVDSGLLKRFYTTCLSKLIAQLLLSENKKISFFNFF